MEGHPFSLTVTVHCCFHDSPSPKPPWHPRDHVPTKTRVGSSGKLNFPVCVNPLFAPGAEWPSRDFTIQRWKSLGFSIFLKFFETLGVWNGKVWVLLWPSRERSHIPPNGKYRTSSTQKCRLVGICYLGIPKRVLPPQTEKIWSPRSPPFTSLP